MSSSIGSDIAIRVDSLSKRYNAYDRSIDRIRQLFARSEKKYYREIWALKKISFEVKRGETVGIIGKNGSGKSTLLQLICGTLEPTTGEIQINGKIAALLELGAGFNPEFSGRENVYLNGSLYGLTREQTSERFDQIAAFADIGAFIDQPVRTYSSGMVVRLAFAVIAHVDADILVIDEALAVGDVYFVQKCMRFLRNFAKNGTLFFVSHDTTAVVALCSKALLMTQGELTRAGTPKDVAEFYLKMLLAGEKPEMVAGNSNDFDSKRARIQSVEVLDEHGAAISTLKGGERALIKIRTQVFESIPSPILGFLVKDRLGQVIFGKNTFSKMTPEETAAKGTVLEATFQFKFPKLAMGHYSVAVALATGTPEEHEQLHWIHDAAVFQVHQDAPRSGLFEPEFEVARMTYRSDQPADRGKT